MLAVVILSCLVFQLACIVAFVLWKLSLSDRKLRAALASLDQYAVTEKTKTEIGNAGFAKGRSLAEREIARLKDSLRRREHQIRFDAVQDYKISLETAQRFKEPTIAKKDDEIASLRREVIGLRSHSEGHRASDYRLYVEPIEAELNAIAEEKRSGLIADSYLEVKLRSLVEQVDSARNGS